MKIDGFSLPTSLSSTNSSSASSHVRVPITTTEKPAKASEQSKTTEQQHEKHLRIYKEEEQKNKLQRNDAEHIVKGLNEFLSPKETNLSFKLHDKLDRYYVEVIDKETKEVIREIPAKELLDMHAKMLEFLGVFIDKKL